MNGFELISIFTQLLEKIFKGRKEFDIVVGLDSGILNFFLELSERISIGAFWSLEESQNTLHFDWLELIINSIQVVSLVFPEFKLDLRSWIVPVLQSLFGFKLKDVFDLLGPSDDASLEDVGFILFRAIWVDNFFVREWQ